MNQYFDLCQRHVGQVVKIREKSGVEHYGKIVNVDQQYVYLETNSHRREFGGYGYGSFGPGFGPGVGYGGFGHGHGHGYGHGAYGAGYGHHGYGAGYGGFGGGFGVPVALAAIGGFALGSAFFW
ncbi:hypothetical protein [Bacillus sp. FJAT-45350]|uniref:hypothetical protein n=1 Tax=Bacillus sp. FJAT-45350 TaxID=2011014 RepID=UPI0015CD2E54|nr:hypothetical protein [Bacillus sp. FJAT-45350]